MRFLEAAVITSLLILANAAAAGQNTITHPREAIDRDGPRRGAEADRFQNDPAWQHESERRRLRRSLRRTEELRQYQAWLRRSTLSCTQAGVPVIEQPDVHIVVIDNAGPWPTVNFTDSTTGIMHKIGLPSPTLACFEEHHDASLSGVDQSVRGRFSQPGGVSHPQGDQVITCYRDGFEVAQERVSDVAIMWQAPSMALSFRRDGAPDKVVIDTSVTGCVLKAVPF